MGAGGWRGTAGLMALLWLRLCTSTPCCIRSTTARPRGGGGQAEAVAKGGQAALLSHLPHRQGVSGNTAPGPSPSPLLHPAWLVSPMTEPPPATQFSPPSPNEAWHCREDTTRAPKSSLPAGWWCALQKISFFTPTSSSSVPMAEACQDQEGHPKAGEHCSAPGGGWGGVGWGVSPQQREAAMSRLGDRHHQPRRKSLG